MVTMNVGCVKEEETIEEKEEVDVIYSKDNKEIWIDSDILSEEVMEEQIKTPEIDFQKVLGDCEEIENKSIEKLDELKAELVEFFKENYELDISKKIESIKTLQFRNEDLSISVCHIPEEKNTIYIHKTYLEQYSKYTRATWVHELMLVLGVEREETKYKPLYDAMAEALTYLFYKQEKRSEPPVSMYTVPAKLCLQMIIVNPQIVNNLLTNEEYKLEDEINIMLENSEYPNFEPNESIVGVYNLVFSTLFATYESPDKEIAFLGQEICTAYCRRFKLSKKKIEELKKYWILPEYDKVREKKVSNV